MFKRIVFLLFVLIALVTAVGLMNTSAYAQDQCVPCEQQKVEFRQSFFSEFLKGWNTGFSRADGGWALYAPLFNSTARAYTLQAQNMKPEDQFQLTGGCYYQFMGPTKCVAHTWYGYFCLQGSWYCYLLGTCKWIPIGSCQ